MAIAKKTFYSPYITHVTEADVSGFTAIEGVIDLIKVTGTNAADGTEGNRSQATVVVNGPGLDSAGETVEVLAGDVLEGPFTKVDITAIVADSTGGHTDVMIYERDKTIVG